MFSNTIGLAMTLYKSGIRATAQIMGEGQSQFTEEIKLESQGNTYQGEESDRKEITQKEKRARCYVCKMRGHVYWKCPNKKKKDLFKHKGIGKPTYKKAANKIKYPEKVKYLEKVHVITDYMIEGKTESYWNEIWYVSSAYKHHMCPTRYLFEKLKYKFEMIGKEETERKFIFSYEVTLNVLSYDLLEEQGYVVEIRNNKCNIHYMIGRKGKKKVQEGSSTDDDGLMDAVTKHNRYLEEYFESIEPKEELLPMKGLDDLKWDKDDVQDYVDEEYISWNGSLYALKVNLLSRLLSFMSLLKKDSLVYKNWEIFSKKFIEMLNWFYQVYLNYERLDEIPPRGLTEDDGEAMRDCYKRFIDMVQVYYETTERPWYEKKPRNEVGESNSGTTKEKDPQGMDKDKAGIEETLEALEEGMIIKT
nr:ARID DNA-binding domain-containing protein [Tanacetum cinerariifolium]